LQALRPVADDREIPVRVTIGNLAKGIDQTSESLLRLATPHSNDSLAANRF
jgi:hypothetical protein